MFLTAAPPALRGGALQARASGAAFRHGWPVAKCSSQQRPRPLGAGVLWVWATGTVFRHGWPVAKCSSQQRPPALGGGCASGTGQWRCVSSRLACGQMFLTAAPRPLEAGVLRVRASGAAFRHGWPAAKCSSQQRPGPWGRVCFGCGPVALRFVTVGLRPNASQSSAPALGGGCASGMGHGHCVSSRLAYGQMFLTAAPTAHSTRISKQIFHKEYSQC